MKRTVFPRLYTYSVQIERAPSNSLALDYCVPWREPWGHFQHFLYSTARLCCLFTVTSNEVPFQVTKSVIHERKTPSCFPPQSRNENYHHITTSSKFPFHFNLLYFRTHFTHYINYLVDCSTKNHILGFILHQQKYQFFIEDIVAFLANIAIYIAGLKNSVALVR
jgi:hypothetical protein